MIGYSTVTQKGQVTIPASIRQKLGLMMGSSVVIEKRGEAIVITPSSDFFDLQGSVSQPKKIASQKQMRESFIDYLGSRRNGKK